MVYIILAIMAIVVVAILVWPTDKKANHETQAKPKRREKAKTPMQRSVLECSGLLLPDYEIIKYQDTSSRQLGWEYVSIRLLEIPDDFYSNLEQLCASREEWTEMVDSYHFDYDNPLTLRGMEITVPKNGDVVRLINKLS